MVQRDFIQKQLEKARYEEENFYIPSQRELKAQREKISRKKKKALAIKAARSAAGYGKNSRPQFGRDGR